MKDITSYKTPSPSTVENKQLSDDLNEFYCRFEKTPFTPPAPPAHYPAPVQSALELLRAAFPPHCSSPFTQTTAHLKTPLSSSWSLQTTPHWSASSRMVTSLFTDRRLRSWLSGAVLTTWSLTRSKPWRWSWTSGETPLLSPHSPSWTALWLQWSHSDSWAPPFLRTWSGTITLSPLWKRPSSGCTVEKVQPATGAAETVLLCHHWIRPLHVNNCLVQLSYQIWPQKNMEGSPDCWANHWYNPPHSPRNVLIQSEQKGWQNHSGPLTSSTLPLWTVTVTKLYVRLRKKVSIFQNAVAKDLMGPRTWVAYTREFRQGYRREPNAAYVHCAAHNLNLVLNDSVKSITELTKFYNTMEKLYMFFVHSIKRWNVLVELTEKLTPGVTLKKKVRY